MALKIRPLNSNDLGEVQELHNRYYPNLELPDFRFCVNAFIIEDEQDEIVVAGVVEKTAEILLTTNKAKSQIKIGKALREAQQCSMFTCARAGIRDAYAFTDNESYAKHLLRHGFENCDRALRLRIS